MRAEGGMMLGLELIYPLIEAQYLYNIHGLIFKKLYLTDFKIFDQRLVSGSSAQLELFLMISNLL